MIVASDVIRMGRRRMRHEFTTASSSGMPSASKRCVNSTMRMLLDTTIPTIIKTPMSDCTLSVVPVMKSATSTPASPVGTASRIKMGSDERPELRHENEIQEHQRQHQAEREASERGLHPFHHPANVDLHTGWEG